MHIFPLGLLKTVLSLLVGQNKTTLWKGMFVVLFFEHPELNEAVCNYPRTPGTLHLKRIINTYNSKTKGTV